MDALKAEAEALAKRLDAWPEPPGWGLTILRAAPPKILYTERGQLFDADEREELFAAFALRGALQELPRARATHGSVFVAFFTTTRDAHDAVRACLELQGIKLGERA